MPTFWSPPLGEGCSDAAFSLRPLNLLSSAPTLDRSLGDAALGDKSDRILLDVSTAADSSPKVLSPSLDWLAAALLFSLPLGSLPADASS